MGKVVIVYESRYGQAAKIAEFIGEVAERRGHTAAVIHVKRAMQLDPSDGDMLFVVSPVYFARHPRTIRTFLRERADAWMHKPSAFFSISNSAADAGARGAEARRIARAFVASTALRPVVIATAAGALAYPRYGFLTRIMMQLIARSKGEPTDRRKVHELTDWDAVEGEAIAALDALAEARCPDVEASGVRAILGVIRKPAVGQA
jgi:menaquinone-dependent protoporphyrinogen oxidase